jgi:enediyne biosynthesis protein E4
MPNRGFQSSSDHQMVFGLGENAKIDSLHVIWPDDQMQTLKNVKADQVLTLNYVNASAKFKFTPFVSMQLFADVTSTKLNYTHQESMFNDWDRDVLLKQKLSTQGPAMAVGDT